MTIQPSNAAMLLWALVTTTACLEQPIPEPGETESFATSDTPSPEERGLLLSSGRWHETDDGVRVGGVSGVARNAPMFATDNSLLLAAMAEPRYAYSRSHGYAAKIRDLIVESYGDDGRVRFGYQIERDSGRMIRLHGEAGFAPRALWGALKFTALHPNHRGARAPAFYERRLSALLAKQQAFVAAGAPNYDQNGDRVLHMASAAVWYSHTRDPIHLQWAKDAWDKVRAAQRDDGSFNEQTGRGVEIAFYLRETLKDAGPLEGLAAAADRLDAVFTNAGGEVSTRGATPCALAGCYAFRLLVGDGRPFIRAGLKATCSSQLVDGRIFVYAGTDSPAPTENQALGWLGMTVRAACN